MTGFPTTVPCRIMKKEGDSPDGNWTECQLSRLAAAAAATPRSAAPIPLSGLTGSRRASPDRCRRTTSVAGAAPASPLSSCRGISGRRRRRAAGGGGGLAGSIGTKHAAGAGTGGQTGDAVCGRCRSPPPTAA